MITLHVIQRYLPAPLSGSEKAFAVLCEALAKQKDQTILVATSNVLYGEGFYDPRSLRIELISENINGVKIRRLPVNWFLASLYYLLNKMLPFINHLSRGRLAVAAFGPQLIGLEQLIREIKPDVIHVSPLPMSHVLTTLKLTNQYRLPLVITPAMHFEDPKFNNHSVYRILKQADQIITHTVYEQQQLATKGLDLDKITVIPSSFLTDQDFHAGNGDVIRKKYKLASAPVVLFIGSKSLDKGTTHLLSAWPKVLKDLPGARLIIAGSSTESWKEARKNSDLTSVVELDYVAEETKHDLLATADLVCVPSRTESFGMILLEAWAKGKPVIGGPAGATREMISEGKDGYTVEFGDTVALAERIIEILSDPKKQATFGRAGQAKAKQFTEAEIVKKTLAVYSRAINEYKSKNRK